MWKGSDEVETGTRSGDDEKLHLTGDRTAIHEKKQELFLERKHLKGAESWDGDVREVAMAKLQQQIESLEQQELEL